MGINFSIGAIALMILVVFIIAVFPEKLCIPFTSYCLFLEPLHYLKTTLTYVVSVVICFTLIAGLVFAVTKLVKFVNDNKAIKPLVKFLLTFDEKHYYELKKAI